MRSLASPRHFSHIRIIAQRILDISIPVEAVTAGALDFGVQASIRTRLCEGLEIHEGNPSDLAIRLQTRVLDSSPGSTSVHFPIRLADEIHLAGSIVGQDARTAIDEVLISQLLAAVVLCVAIREGVTEEAAID